MKLAKLASLTFVTALVASSAMVASAATTKLRIQTHYAPETVSGKLAAKYIDDIQTMSNGEIEVEMFYASSVVKSPETFDAAATGILDCDMTGGSYQTGKNPAFQFVGDIMGGYATPYQQLSWLYFGDGLEAAQKLYNKYGMQLIGWWVYGQESFASSRPIRNADDFRWAETHRKFVSEKCVLYLQPEWSVRDSIMPKIVDYVLKNNKNTSIYKLISQINNSSKKKINIKWLSNKKIEEKIYKYKKLKGWKPSKSKVQDIIDLIKK